MASSKPLEPVLHCTSKSFRDVSTLAHRIVNLGVYAYPLIFTATPKPKVDFVGSLTDLDSDIVEARDSKLKKPNRTAQTIVVFNNIVEILDYVKPICRHNPELIGKTGFDANNQPQKAAIPDQPVITKIIKGKEDGTHKVFLRRRTNKPDVAIDPKTHPKNNTFCIEISLTPEVEESWLQIVAGVKNNNLIIRKYTLNVKNYVRVYGINASGKGQPSMIYSFIPE